VVVDKGFTEILFPVPPVLQVYVVPPAAVNVELLPLQIPVGDAETEIAGAEAIETVTEADPLHPFASVPVTVYVVVDEGFTIILDPLPPVLQLYVEPPLAERVELCPGQTDEGEAVTVIVGLGLTLTVAVIVPVQPLPFEPVTVYVVVFVGETVILLFVLPELHAYVVAPAAERFTDSPEQIDVE